MNDENKEIKNNEITTSCDEQSQLDLKEAKAEEETTASKKQSSFFTEIKTKSKGYDFTSVIITAASVVIALIIVFAVFPACNIDLLHNVYNSVSAEEILHVDENNSTSAPSSTQDDADISETDANKDAISPADKKVKVNKTETQIVYDKVVESSGKTASINISNPNSNKYIESIKIYSATDNTDIYYQSDMLKPGTGLVKITLSKSVGDEAIPVIIEFTFYDSDLTVLDTQMVGATLTPEEKLETTEATTEKATKKK